MSNAVRYFLLLIWLIIYDVEYKNVLALKIQVCSRFRGFDSTSSFIKRFHLKGFFLQ